MTELLGLGLASLAGFVSGALVTLEFVNDREARLREKLHKARIDLAVARAQLRALKGDTSWD